MGTKSGNMAIVYSSVAVLSVLLLIGYLLWEKKKVKHLTLLFTSVAVANIGYFLQSVSHTRMVRSGQTGFLIWEVHI